MAEGPQLPPPERVALVTGGSRGLGRAIALRLARDGFAIALTYREQAQAADEVVAAIAAAGGRAVAIRADVAEPSGADAAFAAADTAFGGIDVLVNNAGLSILAPLAEMENADFQRVVAVNLFGVFNMLKRAATRLRTGGRIVNLSSTAVAINRPGYGAYVASKAGVEALTRTFAAEMRGRSVIVNALAPGLVGHGMFLMSRTPEQIAAMAALSPLERLAGPDEIASVVAFLAGPDGAWVNGQVLRANGGAA